LLADLSDGGSTGGLAPGSAHALIKAAIDDGQPTRRTVVIDNSEDDGRAEADERSPANPRRPAPAAILAYEQELATLREMPTDLESLQVAAAGLTRLYTQLQLLSSNASGEWKLAALVLMGECATALAERGEAATPTLCNDQDLTREECVALLEKLEEQSARERATDIYRSAVTFAEQQHLDTAYSRLAKSRLAGNK
jgi:hypothetical protein